MRHAIMSQPVRPDSSGRYAVGRFPGLLVGLAILAVGCSSPGTTPTTLDSSESAAALAEAGPLDVLVFSKTAGYRHASIEAGIAALRRLGERFAWNVHATEDAARFTDEGLAAFDVVVFLSTTGDVLDDAQQAAFERFIRRGGGYAGIHAASDTEYDWPWYAKLVGAYFRGHPAVQEADIHVFDRAHPSTRHLDDIWRRTDEWYDFRRNPRGKVHVLASLDESTYKGGGMGADHPIAWCHEYDGGRAWYTALGHTEASFSERAFLDHVAGGIRWAGGRIAADAGATIDAHYDKVVLDEFVTDPMELTVLPDLRVVFVERQGIVKIWRPDLASTVIAGFVDVFDGLEDGLLGVTADPAFFETGWIYLYYSPREGEPRNVLSRFTLVGDTLDPDSEIVMLEVGTQRDECCHAGGSLTFDGAGNLYLSTGDNTNPFESSGYAPIDERDGRAPFDAQKSSANPNDLRGKILRIRPEANGSYSIPQGNLFPSDGSRGRPEIYVMGCRNPFRISVDPETGTLYWGDVGPDASVDNDERGPAGHDEFNRTNEAGNFGWPYFVGPNLAYRDYDFTSATSGDAFEIDAPENDSPNNTGVRQLPPARPAWIGYTYGPKLDLPVLGAGGRCAMAGPTVRLDRTFDHPNRLPPYFDGSVFLYEWARNQILEARLDRDGELVALHPFLASETFLRPHDLELGPDGRLYMIEWGTGFGGGNDDARVVRIDYHPSGERPPVARFAMSRSAGPAPLPVVFDARRSESRAIPADLTYAWDFDSDGRIDDTAPVPVHAYQEPGDYTVTLTVTDAAGLSSTASAPIAAGNTPPEVTIAWPPDGGIVELGDAVRYEVRVTDIEDGDVADERLIVQPYLGHDTHAHPLHQKQGPRGRIETLRDDGHGADADLFTVLSATATDRGAPGVAPLTTRAEVILQPRTKQAEYATELRDARIEKNDASASIVFDGEKAYAVFAPVHLHGIDAITMRLATELSGGHVVLFADEPEGERLGSAELPAAGRITLEAGEPVPVRVDFFERGGGAGVILRILGPDVPKQPVPADWWQRPDQPESSVGGVLARAYEIESVSEIPDFDSLAPVAESRVATIDYASSDDAIAGATRADDFGLVFTGDLVVPTSGEYAFTLESDDGARLTIDGRTVIDNDGLHGMIEKSSGGEWREITIPVTNPGRTIALVVVFEPARGHEEGAMRLDWLRFDGPGASLR